MKIVLAIVLFCAASTQAFHFKQCSGPDRILNIKTVTIKQDPVVFPGPLDVSFTAETFADMPSPIKIEMKLTKAGLELPCIPIKGHMLGSCTYADICDSLAKLPESCIDGGILGTIIHDAGLPCRCPLTKNGNVAVTNAHVDLPKAPSFIAFMAEGEVTIHAKATDGAGKVLGCAELKVNVHFKM